MSKIWAMRGYSGSGKSTRAREIADANNAVVINRDLIRLMLLGSHWTGKKQDEDRVSVAEMAQVEAFLLAGTQVVVDATHLNPKYLRQWQKLATRLGVDFQVVDVLESPDECRRRDHARMLGGGRYVGDKVIDEQAKRFPCQRWPNIVAKPFEIEPVEFIPGLPDAYLFDIDGTLAHMDGRSPYDYSRVSEDVHDLDVGGMLRMVYGRRWSYKEHPRVIIMSGRDGDGKDGCRGSTIDWLNANDCWYDDLFMRPEEDCDGRGNKSPDYQVKYNLFNKHIRGVYNVRGVFDDRKQVVDMWRKLGLKCFQVAEGNF